MKCLDFKDSSRGNVAIGSRNDLLPDATKPLTETELTYCQYINIVDSVSNSYDAHRCMYDNKENMRFADSTLVFVGHRTHEG